MNGVTSQIVVVATAIVGLATLAVLVSKGSQTPAVIKSATDGFASSLRAATAPVTGGGSLSLASM